MACLPAFRTCAADVARACRLGEEGTQLVPYYAVLCALEEALGGAPGAALAVAAGALWLLVLLSMLQTTADTFFVPQLERASEALGLTPAVAGLTILALGNSAPDAFADVAAVGDDDLNLALGEMLGSAVFLTSVVLAAVLVVSTTSLCPSVEVCKPAFLRDVGVYALAVAVIVGVASQGTFSLAVAVALLALYVVYVAGRIATGGPRDSTAQFGADEAGLNAVSLLDSDERAGDDDAEPREDPLVGFGWEKDDSAVRRIQLVLEWPFTTLRYLSIPNPDGKPGAMRERLAAVAPLGASVVLLLGFHDVVCPSCSSPYHALVMHVRIGGSNVPALACAAAPAALLGLVALIRPRLALVPLSVLSFVSAIAWMELVGDELVALLEVSGRITGISSTLMGATVLSWANSIGDLVADTACARAGYPDMAIASVFGAPLLTACLGIGLAVAVSAGGKGPPFVLRDVTVTLGAWLSVGSLALNLVLSVVFTLRGGSLPRTLGWVLLCTYLMYTVALIALELFKN